MLTSVLVNGKDVSPDCNLPKCVPGAIARTRRSPELPVVPEGLSDRLGRLLLHDQHEHVQDVAPRHEAAHSGTHLQKSEDKLTLAFFVFLGCQ